VGLQSPSIQFSALATDRSLAATEPTRVHRRDHGKRVLNTVFKFTHQRRLSLFAWRAASTVSIERAAIVTTAAAERHSSRLHAREYTSRSGKLALTIKGHPFTWRAETRCSSPSMRVQPVQLPSSEFASNEKYGDAASVPSRIDSVIGNLATIAPFLVR